MKMITPLLPPTMPFTWHACGCLSGEHLHAHTFIYMQQSVLFAAEVPIRAQAFQCV